MTIHNKFTHEGKEYTAEPKPYVRIGEALFKVKSTDGEGNAVIVASGKKDPAPEDVAIAAPVDRGLPPNASNGAGEQTPSATPDLATLKAEWADAHDAVERVKAEYAAALEKATSDLLAAESRIATNLLARPRKRGEAVPVVKLGEATLKATKDRNDGPPRLTAVTAIAAVE